MRIIIATGIFPPEIGGPATVANQLASALTTTGYSVTVISYAPGASQAMNSDKFSVQRVTRSGIRGISYLKYLIALFRLTKKKDLIIALDPYAVGLPVFLTALIKRSRYIIRFGGDYMWELHLSKSSSACTLAEFYERHLPRRYPVLSYVLKQVQMAASAVIFNSSKQKLMYQSYFSLPTERASVIANPNQYPLSAINLPEKKREFVFCGRLTTAKNIDGLIKGFAQITDQSYRLRIIGDGPQRGTLDKLVQELGVKHRVIFEPALTGDTLWKSIATCRAVIIPSWTDVAPQQFYECLARDIPVLLTSESFLSLPNELMRVNPSSIDDIAAKLEALTKPQGYADLCISCQKVPRDRSVSQMIQEYIALIESLDVSCDPKDRILSEQRYTQ